MELMPISSKRVVLVGDGGQSPSQGDTVIFHKTFLTTNDRVIISSIGVGEYELPLDENRMPEALFKALSEMTINEISSFTIHPNSTPNYGQENSSEVVGQLTRGGKCLLHVLDIQTGKEKHAKGKGKAEIEDLEKASAEKKPGEQPKLLADAIKASVEKQPKLTEKEKQARGGKGKPKIKDLEKASAEKKPGEQPKLSADAIKASVEKQPKLTEKEKQARGRKGKPKIKDLEKASAEKKPGEQPKLLADAIKASVEKQPKLTEKEKKARGGKGKANFEDLEKASAEKKPAASEDLEKAEDLEEAQTRSSLTQVFGLGRSSQLWLNLSGIGWLIAVMLCFKRVLDWVLGWVSGWVKRIRPVIQNRVFIKGIQFIVFGGIILGEKVRFVDEKKYPVKYGVLYSSGIFSLVFGFGLSIFFPRVGANFLDFISYVEIWIAGLGYLA